MNMLICFLLWHAHSPPSLQHQQACSVQALKDGGSALSEVLDMESFPSSWGVV